MSSDWVFNSTSSESNNIELIYCSAVLESCPAQYVFSIKMKSGTVLNLNDYKRHINIFSESDMVAISAAGDNLTALYNKEDKLYFNEDDAGYNLTKDKTFGNSKVVQTPVVKNVDEPNTPNTQIVKLSIFGRIKAIFGY